MKMHGMYVKISDSIYRPVQNSSPDGPVQRAVLKNDNYISANELFEILRSFISAAPFYLMVRRVSAATIVPSPALLVC
jgi:hypothetical protein